MFKRRNSHPKVFNIDTLIGAGTRVHGDIQFVGGLHVDGRVQGNIVAAGERQADKKSASLSISDSGEVEGSVHAPHVILNGTVVGDIVADRRVELGATAKVDGNVYYGLIEMAMGAQINGKLIHYPAPAMTHEVTDSEAVAIGISATASSSGDAVTAGNELG